MPTYRRSLSPNELSYFLPSRADGVNDLFTQVTFHAPPSLVSPMRVRTAWAILRLRHSLMSCRVEMEAGRYDEAQFVLTPPSSPSQALAEAAASVRILDNISGAELSRTFLGGSRALSSECLSRLDVARHRRVSTGIYEFSVTVMLPHMISDGVVLQEYIHIILELLGGSAAPNGLPRTDAELMRVLSDEWTQYWGTQRRTEDAIAPATEARIPGLAQSSFQRAAWKVDHQNIQRRFIGGHIFPRIKSTTTNFRFVQTQFDVSQTKAIFAKCKSQGVSVASMGFGLCNLAWIRLCAAHPEINAPKNLPMLMYTAINFRRYFEPSPLDSCMSIALGYFNIVLPTFLPTDISPRKMFWARSRAAQRQISKYAQSPLLPQRAVVTSKLRGESAKAWARIDDEANGTLPPSPRAPTPSTPNSLPSLALLGFAHSGNWDQIYRPEAYPAITLIDAIGGAKRQPGGMLLYSWTLLGRLNFPLLWDDAGFPPGLMEEFRRYLVDGVYDYVLEDPSLKGTAKEVDCLVHLLGLSDSVITTPKSSPAAKNRFLHVPGTPGIYKIPGPSISYLWNELRYFIQPGINFELVRGWNRPEGVLDESLESFMTRRGHAVTARVLGSALVHGIYAADARLLSVRAAFPRLWELEEKGNGRILWYLLTRSKEEKLKEKEKEEEDRKRYQLGDVLKLMEGASVYSFRDGMGTLADALTRSITKNPNIRIISGAEVTALQFDDEHGFQPSRSQPSTKSSPSRIPCPISQRTPSSSVTAINLVFPGTKIFPPGFGYLVCRPKDDYPADDAGILGVTFDSAALPAQDTLAPGEKITKVTVMMGGPHRSPDTALPVVLAHLQYHLNRRKPLPEPLVTRTWHHKECIPTPLPGHLERIKKLKEALGGSGWDGRMEVVGAGVRGVSVGDCVESGKMVGIEW
ncbi:hypothetical protein MSAN_01924500 [Mycena sanguinolenta]|uniref:Uncharacterized protein n=1 Tax=Mycena sanguinolenta TaxID=230812 RepID=A0A8H6XMH8_9AGAR|nr:hypothetical protein MSAN_01924500 [Mycena sanguinolenta]